MTSHIEHNGKFYGYPECCVRAFLSLVKFAFLSKEQKATANYGFVPCQTCAERILKGDIKIHELISSERQFPRPFIRFV